LPIDGDSILVPAGKSIVLDEDYSYKNVVINIEFNTATNSEVSVRLVNLSGQVMLHKNFQLPSYKVSMDNLNVNTGIYLVQVSDAGKWNVTARVML